MTSFLRLRKRRRKHHAIQLSTRSEFEIDQKLIGRQIAEAERLGENSIKRVLPAMPRDYSDLELDRPIG